MAALKRMESRDGARPLESESQPSTSYALPNAPQPSDSYGPPSLPPPSYSWATSTPLVASPPQASNAWMAPPPSAPPTAPPSAPPTAPPTAPPLPSVPPPQAPASDAQSGWIDPPSITMYNF